MPSAHDLLIRNVEIEGRKGLDVLILNGVVTEIGQVSRPDVPSLDGRGGALIPGLQDHHIHLLALAADRRSIRVGPEEAANLAQFEKILRDAARLNPTKFLRATQYHESVAGPLDRDRLDQLPLPNPLRVQYRTGSLWVLNSAALAQALPDGALPSCVECDAGGRPTGRIWRGDAWLRSRLENAPPIDLSAIGAELARCGVIGVTDTSVTTGQSEAALLAAAHKSGSLPQRLLLMSGGELLSPADGAYEVGPLKILLDDSELGDIEPTLAKIALARSLKRNIAVHCVTAAELAFTLAAFDQAGTWPGDRIEHGGIIYDDALEVILRLGLTVVTQPSFIAERGDIYLDEVDASDLPYLYRCASLLKRGIALAASTDAPYTKPDLWASMQAAVARLTRRGRSLGGSERVDPQTALGLFLGEARSPSVPRRIAIGEAADFCLLHLPLDAALRELDRKNVAATIIGGRIAYQNC